MASEKLDFNRKARKLDRNDNYVMPKWPKEPPSSIQVLDGDTTITIETRGMIAIESPIGFIYYKDNLIYRYSKAKKKYKIFRNT